MEELFYQQTKGTIYPVGDIFVGWLPKTAEYNDACAVVVAYCKEDLRGFTRAREQGVRLFYAKGEKLMEAV